MLAWLASFHAGAWHRAGLKGQDSTATCLATPPRKSGRRASGAWLQASTVACTVAG